ncbi:MAG TPA: hypothetical protein ENJ84_10845 [Gammaproteobacteria bacterium]|nr:hypothetical protein [Gammaproteobacteria bacterium]
MCIDATVQEKTTTFPTDANQYRKIHGHLLKLARTEGMRLTRTYEREVTHLKLRTRFSSHPRNRKKARLPSSGSRPLRADYYEKDSAK